MMMLEVGQLLLGKSGAAEDTFGKEFNHALLSGCPVNRKAAETIWLGTN